MPRLVLALEGPSLLGFIVLSNPISMLGDEDTNSTNNNASDGPLLEVRA
jgi:hypothetical protein